jgi:hypothetical protein
MEEAEPIEAIETIEELDTGGGPTARAAAAVALADAEPERAAALAAGALSDAERAGDTVAACTALRALGLAARETGELAVAAGYLRRAVAIATSGGLTSEVVGAMTSLALVQLYRGDTREALEQTELAARGATGTALGGVLHQRALVLYRLGRLSESQECYRRALRIFRRRHEAVWEARTLLNRAVLLTDIGLPAAAEEDLRRVTAISGALGHPGLAAKAAHNLGFLAARTGDFPRALAIYDSVEDQFRALGLPLGRLQLDRCEVLLSVRLIPESRQLARQAAAELAAAGHATESAEAQLLVSHAALLDNEAGTALETAEQARRTFRRQQRPGWLAQAHLAVARARWEGGDRSERALEAARRARQELDDVGLPVLALEAGLIAARVALDAGRRRVAVGELERASRARRRGPAQLRAQAWHAESLLRLYRGDRRGAFTALRAGLGALRQAQAALGATELRAHAAGHGERLARLGLQLAVEGGRPDQVLTWAEQWRAEGLRTRPVRPPQDAVLAADLAELRRVTNELDEAAAGGRPTADLLGRQAGLERIVARRARQARGAAGRATPPPSSVDGLRASLAGRALLELVQLDDVLWSVTIADRHLRLRCLGPTARLVDELGNLRFALRRMVAPRGSPASKAAAAQSALHASAQLDDLLIGPSRSDLGDRPLVIVPTGPLHALPWAALPHCRSRPFTVAPSGALWELTERRTGPGPARPVGAGGISGPVTLAAGPGLPGGSQEVTDLAELYVGCQLLTGGRADVATVLAALDGSATAHIAAHGTYRADSPLFSSLRLADGPLTVYDLEGLPRPPGLLVLSACDSGVSAVRPGDELMGLSSALLGLGTRSVVAGALVVPDRATRPLMVELHRRLQAGDRPAAALATARSVTEGSALDTPEAFAAAASFLCFGAG